jgi:acyl dehydratase
MVDFVQIGYRHPAHSVDVEQGKLRFFAKAIGETHPVYVDEAAARAAELSGLAAPPTYAFSLELDQVRPFAVLEKLGVRLERVLHGSQRFMYHTPICAGDRITLQSVVKDIYEKKGGALKFIVISTTAMNQRGEVAVEMTKTIVVRQPRSMK